MQHNKNLLSYQYATAQVQLQQQQSTIQKLESMLLDAQA